MARAVAKESPPIHDGVCFHCQQAAEKYLKAYLQELGAHVPRTHDLVRLHALIAPHDGTLKGLVRGFRFLSVFAVDFRYPDANATVRQARAALRWAERIRREIRRRLKLRS
ncbi:MAG: HEPN domain-containing protein [Planctomycetes bacterium]|nr:HEPN domain-containing protein [Planctomycetota bacterium]